MTKRFTAAPKPKQLSDEQIAAYERGGPGHDNSTSRTSAAPAEKPKRLSIDLPLSTHRRFKTACSATGRKMNEEIERFIERRIAELEEEAGIART